MLGESFYLFDMKPAVKWVTRIGTVSASRNFSAPSAPTGVVINYYQKAAASGDVKVQMMKGARVVAENPKAPNAAGVNTLDLEHADGQRRAAWRASGGRGRPRGRRRRRHARRRGALRDPVVRRRAASRSRASTPWS